MEPEEWERLADEFAATVEAELQLVETTYWPAPPAESFRPFWATVKRLNERVRTAPAIKLDDKLRLQRRLNELCQRARQDQKHLQEEREAREHALEEALAFAEERVTTASSIDEINELRSDLALLRERIVAEARHQPGRHHQPLWHRWQGINQAAWARLNELWARNERALSEILDKAAASLEGGDVRTAKESIKQFHASSTSMECSHRSLRSLRGRAGSLWQRANDIGREKHQRYLEQAEKRVDQWRQARERQSRMREALERQIAQLERQSSAAPTDVGAALLRGQLDDRRRALSRLESESRDLQQRIEAAEVALGD